MLDIRAMHKLKLGSKLAAALAVAVLAVASTSAAVSAHPTPTPRCDGETYAVVSAPGDTAMAELIASWQVLDTACVVPPDQAERLISAAHETVVLGGTKAVPASAVDSLNVIVRLAGADRVATANAVLEWVNARLSTAEATPTVTTAPASPGFLARYKDIAAWGESISPADFPDLNALMSELIGNGCNWRKAGGGLCEGMSGFETWQLQALRACPVGWSFAWVGDGARCYHPQHRDYDSRLAYHSADEASAQVVYPPLPAQWSCIPRHRGDDGRLVC